MKAAVLSLSAGAIALAPTTPAAATTTVGVTAKATSACDATIYWNSAGPGVLSVQGVITALRFTTSDTSGHVSLKVLRDGHVYATTPSLTINADGIAEQTGLSIAVKPGDELGTYANPGVECIVPSAPATSSTSVGVAESDPGVGTTVSATGSVPSLEVGVSATMQADTDGDGFGDETQDACPADATRHLTPCASDLTVSATAIDANVGVGEIAAVSTTVANTSTLGVTGATSVATLPTGVTLVGADHACTPAGSTVTCTLGAIAAGSTTTTVLAVRVGTAGAHAIGFTAHATQPDSFPGNDNASATVTASAHVTPACTVPRVVGLPVSFAKQLLTAKGCALGTVTKKKSSGKKGVVSAQTKKPGTKLAHGAKVAVTVRR